MFLLPPKSLIKFKIDISIFSSTIEHLNSFAVLFMQIKCLKRIKVKFYSTELEKEFYEYKV